MNRQDFSFISETDGLEISAFLAMPEGEPKGIVQIVHGMNEYKERYLDFAEFLVSSGYAVGMHDHRGHGKSVKCFEDLGYMYEGRSEGLLEDAHQFSLILKEKAGAGKPFILIGHSMGSFVVRRYIKKYDDEITKLVVIGSPSKLAGAGLGLFMTKLVGKLKGEKGKSKLLDYLVTGMSYEGKFPGEGKFAWVCGNKEILDKYKNDKYCMYTFTANGYRGLIESMIDTYSPDGWQMKAPQLPVYFFSGELDPCAVSPAEFEKSIQFLKDRGYKNVQGKMYPGMRHEVLNEKENGIVYNDILTFIEQ